MGDDTEHAVFLEWVLYQVDDTITCAASETLHLTTSGKLDELCLSQDALGVFVLQGDTAILLLRLVYLVEDYKLLTLHLFVSANYTKGEEVILILALGRDRLCWVGQEIDGSEVIKLNLSFFWIDFALIDLLV